MNTGIIQKLKEACETPGIQEADDWDIHEPFRGGSSIAHTVIVNVIGMQHVVI